MARQLRRCPLGVGAIRCLLPERRTRLRPTDSRSVSAPLTIGHRPVRGHHQERRPGLTGRRHGRRAFVGDITYSSRRVGAVGRLGARDGFPRAHRCGCLGYLWTVDNAAQRRGSLQ